MLLSPDYCRNCRTYVQPVEKKIEAGTELACPVCGATLGFVFCGERPSDDAEPITVDWLTTLSSHDGDDSPWIYWEDDNGWLLAYSLADKTWSVYDNEIPSRHIKTRGDVRRLLAALGITA